MTQGLKRMFVRYGFLSTINVITEMYPTGHPVRQALLIDDRDKIYEAFEKKLELEYPEEIEEEK
jgi:hypothetical protein